MKSDLVGKIKADELKTSTLYLVRKLGVVFLTDPNKSQFGTVVHSVSAKYPIGRLVNANGFNDYEPLGGTITLSNS